MTPRKTLSTKERVGIFKRHNGICHLCQEAIQAGTAWEVSHETPLELGGKDDASNWLPAHKACHREYTALVDQPKIAKAKRQEAKHLGAVRPKQTIKSAPMPKSGKRDRHPVPLPPRMGGIRFVGGA